MKGLKVDIVPCLSDNYAYLIEDVKSGVTAIVDPSEADPVIQKLNQLDKKLDYILNKVNKIKRKNKILTKEP